MRREFEMTQDDLDGLLDASKPVVYIVAGGVPPRSPQENANSVWAGLGRKMGFRHMTVRPTTKGDRFFTADATP